VTVGASAPVTPVKPVVLTPAGAEADAVPPPPASDLPPPPPPPPPKAPRRFFRKLLIYTTIATLIFYPTSGYISTKSDGYREFFVNTFPLGETIADYAEDHEWDELDLQSVTAGLKATSAKSKELADRVKALIGQDKSTDVKDEVSRRVEGVAKDTKSAVHSAGDRLEDARAKAEAKFASLKKEASTSAESLKQSAVDAQKKTGDLVDAAKNKTAEIAGNVKDKAAEVASHVQPIHFSDGVERLVDEAEKALGIAKDKLTGAPADVAAAGQSQYPDSLPPRGVKAEGASSADSAVAGKKLYTGPPLPLGFEPPPGYYLPKPPSDAAKVSPPDAKVVKAQPNLPLLAPIVQDFAAEEPIISQLASTIDSLATSLSATSSAATATDSTSPESILTKAKDDLSSLSSRLESLKQHEKSELQKTVQEKTREFERLLDQKQNEWRNHEGELQAGWQEEKEKLIEGWRKVLERELEGQRSGIEQRLREEVVAQGIELQRRWLRSIKAQVEASVVAVSPSWTT